MKVRVEVCATSLAEAMAAARAGVDSVELCTWPDCGGVTPSYGLVNAVKEDLGIPLRVLIRATPGGFHYTMGERQAMLRDALLIGMSVPGLVIGALDEDGAPDSTFIRAVRMAAPEAEVTFHRAIDRSTDPAAAFASCMAEGVQRVLTSGGRTLAIDGALTIKAMVEGAQGRLQVAAAGGITPQNVVELVERTGVTEVHFAARRKLPPEPHEVSMSSGHRGISFDSVPDEAKMEGVLNALVKARLR
ncbi:MAG: copper homeostasis protein CutC [Flavobacteriales bacterium]|nr:Copper homeostasis protein CutC [Flavobacteriales bacterium]MCC6578566.1 copper homeostasis protein CutC [Flavobacteriales bacterium]